jgi:CHAT domain-containing protein/Tfp pilus assembly protein PilF
MPMSRDRGGPTAVARRGGATGVRRPIRRPLALAAALVAFAACAGPAAAQPWARFAVPDSALPATLKANAAGYEAAWNALLVAELRARLAKADSARRLLDLAERVARAEPVALGSTIGGDALDLRSRWNRTERQHRVRAAVSESLAVAAQAARDYARADSLFRHALAGYRALGERRRTAWLLGSIGQTAFLAGDYARADSVYRLALAARRALPDLRMTGATLNAVGLTGYMRGRFGEAAAYLDSARMVREQTGEMAARATTLNLLGLTYSELGDPVAARASFEQALSITTTLGDSARTLEVLVNQAATYVGSGDPAEAEAITARAMAIAREQGNLDRQAILLSNLGNIRVREGRYTDGYAALEEAAGLAAQTGDPRREARLLIDVGLAGIRLMDARAARPPLERALALADSVGDTGLGGQASHNLAIVAQLEGDLTGAEGSAHRALARAVAVGDSGLARAVSGTLGDLALERGDRGAAREWFARAVAISADGSPATAAADLVNLGVATVADRPDEAGELFRRAEQVAREAGLPEVRWPAMLGLGDVAERRGDYATALAWDRAAATLIDTLRGRQGAEQQAVSLLAHRRFAFDALIHLLTKLDPRHPDSGYAAEAFHWAERARARALLDQLAGGGEAAQPLTLPEARRLVGPGEALLEYSLGDSSTTLWVITGGAVRTHMLPGRKSLQTRGEVLRRGLADPQRAESRSTLNAARALWRALIEPALPALAGVRHLILSPDGPLQLVPFEALLATDPVEGRPPAAGDWLASRFATSYTFSAGALFALRGEAAGRAVVAVADPSFGDALPALPNTAEEAAVLSALAPPRPYVGLAGAEATRERLLALPELSQAGVLHIATHGVANEVEPDRSGLWLAVEAGGQPGLLAVPDIRRLRLQAELVTLSACETGLGRLERGEGVVGLTRAFLAAGSKSVVVSLWKVNDRSTARLMRTFYEGLLREKRGRPESLAAARRALLKAPETRAPFYWAPFVLIGEAGRLR